MNQLEILQYIIYGYSFLVVLISFSFTEDLRNSKFFIICFLASLISLALGVVFELTNKFDEKRYKTLYLMSIPIIFLILYKILFKIFKVWKGTDPCFTSYSSKLGGNVDDGFWAKHPKDRKFIWTDFFSVFFYFLYQLSYFLGLN